MKKRSPEDFVFYRGEKFQVEFYYLDSGEMPAKEYFDSANVQVQTKLLALVKYIAEHGRIFDEGKFRIVDKGARIYEFKPMAERFFNFFADGRRIIITNAYRKKGQKVDPRAVAHAIDLKNDYEYRVREGSYYED